MTAGIKTYNDAINVDSQGRQVSTIARQLQARGFALGLVTNVPISHATPAAAYANNVSRDDYQDLTRDLLGLASVAHPDSPLPGADVLIGAGWGQKAASDSGQGSNFVPGNKYLTDEDLARIDQASGGAYRVCQRTAGANGSELLNAAAAEAARHGQRLLGFFGILTGHLPYQTADGGYDPAPGRLRIAEPYSKADLHENPTLADMTRAALTVLSKNPEGFWLMIEPGDVDWANHDNNLDNSIGAVLSGDAAIKVITDWVERNSNWRESLLIVTADHGHMLHVVQPEALCAE
jgi:alkaline phosphatase